MRPSGSAPTCYERGADLSPRPVCIVADSASLSIGAGASRRSPRLRLPKAEHKAAEWQAAMEALILVATSGGPTMFARIGLIRALNRGYVREFDTSRKDHYWGKAEAKEGPMKTVWITSIPTTMSATPTI